jgi:hypothetical protein
MTATDSLRVEPISPKRTKPTSSSRKLRIDLAPIRLARMFLTQIRAVGPTWTCLTRNGDKLDAMPCPLSPRDYSKCKTVDLNKNSEITRHSPHNLHNLSASSQPPMQMMLSIRKLLRARQTLLVRPTRQIRNTTPTRRTALY